MKEYNVHEVLAILQKYHITDSQQMVTRWIREGKLHGVRSKNRKEGYMISEEDLYEFIEEQRPGTPAMMFVYEDYINKLGTVLFDKGSKEKEPEETQEKVNKTNVNEDETNTENYRLSEQMKTLESRIIHLEDEKQKMEEMILEIQEQNNLLTKQNQLLKEERSQFVRLNVLLKKEIEQLKSTNQATLELSAPKEKQTALISKKEFLDVGKEVVAGMNLEVSDEGQTKHYLLQVYDQIYAKDGNIRKELIRENGQFICPFSDKIYKQQKRLVKTAITTFMETNRKKIEHEVTEKTMINTKDSI